MASSKEKKVCLYDPENGTTTGLFIEQFEKEVEQDHCIVFENFNIEDMTSTVPVVTIVRSTTERAEEDLDTVLKIIRYKKFPVIIIYIHMKSCSSISQTKTSLKDQRKYKHVLEIIDMDFTDNQLIEGRTIANVLSYIKKRQLKRVNSEAISRLYKVVWESGKVKVCLYDPKNGTTTGRFIEQFEKEVKQKHFIVFDKFNYKDVTGHVSVVMLVCSTPEGLEDDLQKALATIQDKDIPIIIICIHMKSCSSISQTKRSLKDQEKYNIVVEIIDMDFTNYHLRYERSFANYIIHGKKILKRVNSEAISRLYKVVCDCTSVVNENKLCIYDKIKNKHSETIFDELEQFMHGRLCVEKTENPTTEMPLAVIVKHTADYVTLDISDDFQDSDIILIRLCSGPEVPRTRTRFEMIDIDINDKGKYLITFVIGEQLIGFVKASYMHKKMNSINPPISKDDKTFGGCDKDGEDGDANSQNTCMIPI